MRAITVLTATLLMLGGCGEASAPAETGPALAARAAPGPADSNKQALPVTFNALGQPVLIEPRRAGQTEVIVNAQPTAKYWAAMTQDEIRSQLDLTETVIQVEKIGRSGSITPAIGSISVSKGSYRVSFLYMQYKNEACGVGGTARVGVGMVVSAVINTNERKLTLSSLLPLVAAAEDNKVSGSLIVRTIGITSTSSVLSGYVGQNLQLTTESLIKAMESLAVVRAVLESSDARLSPNFMAVNGGAGAQSCLTTVVPDAQAIGSRTPLTAAMVARASA